ncbi:DNA-binding protein, partial [Sphaerotilus sulfidivorans]|uniref:DNA-binding protein n=1 Tax=Sphaerotilus sulfidivorans TaxID=639200 RepID=UPI0015DB1998
MSRGITEQDVWKAADVLLLEGARPTIERVRLKIGRGSPNTVSPHLESWFARLGARIADPQAFRAPDTDAPEPVRDQDDRLLAGQLLDALLNDPLGFGIQRRGGLVEDPHRAV